ncbi:hypothetical protein BS50DRAFT_126313 [Corynespora cassiicola Philippines]|uniref:VOC domain-containing protein n=1 Tax=Corynespora cassiicola Philippines TaxID=1448308 RepID=A0A2T2NB43_CORCC|nr:hypothetical protein BS50DRAFT_126313 [Corynespora cassiicola Philippines]
MPVSHIGLTVSHLPTSCSFFLSALQPLGYRYIGQQGNQIGLGIRDADFFLCQETPGVKAGAAHIAFTARDRTSVREFYAAALTAGGRPNGAPACRTEGLDHFNAAVLDLDGNSIEVVFRNEPDFRDDGTVIEHSRVITWSRSYSGSVRDDRSVVSSRTHRTTTSSRAPSVAEPVEKAPTVVSKAPSKAPSVARSISEPTPVPQVAPSTTSTSDGGDGAAKKIIGTLLGAAAGAAVAYAMCKSEQDSAKKESEFNAFMEAKNLAAQAKEAFKQTMQPDPQPPANDAQPQLIHRPDSDSQSTVSQQRSVHVPRAIEPAPPSYYQAPSYVSAPPTEIVQRPAIEYAPAYSVAPSRASFTAPHRSLTSPELSSASSVSKSKSVASRAQSVAHSAAPSAAPSTLISSFVPDHVERRRSEGSVASHHSSRSKAKSSHTSASKHSSSRSRAPSPPPSKAPSAAPSKSPSKAPSAAPSKAPTAAPSQAPSKAPSKVPTKVASIVGSILGRDSKSTTSKSGDPFGDDYEIEEVTDDDDLDTVAPSDSISQVGSSIASRSRRHRRHRSDKHESGSTVSKHSSSSRHSKSSKHSHRSKRSHHSRHDDDDAIKRSVISEPSDASTVKPLRPKSSRKDSVTQGQYDGLFNGVQYGTGNVATLPVRGITPSMVMDQSKNKSMISYSMGQKLRAFEG